MDELTDLAARLRNHLDIFINTPTGAGYNLLRNKIAEYYSVSAARQEEAYAREQERKREELDIVARKGDSDSKVVESYADEEAFNTEEENVGEEQWTCEDCGEKFDGPPLHQLTTGVLCDECGEQRNKEE